MGYNTAFEGHLTITPPLNVAEVSYLRDFSASRRYRRAGVSVSSLSVIPADSQHDAEDYNVPPADQPGLWCDFAPSANPQREASTLEWTGGEKTYYAPDWIEFLIDKLLSPSAREYLDAHLLDDPRLREFTADHVCSGSFRAYGEDRGDMWAIIVEDNVVSTHIGVSIAEVSDEFEAMRDSHELPRSDMQSSDIEYPSDNDVSFLEGVDMLIDWLDSQVKFTVLE